LVAGHDGDLLDRARTRDRRQSQPGLPTHAPSAACEFRGVLAAALEHRGWVNQPPYERRVARQPGMWAGRVVVIDPRVKLGGEARER
jgi:hypothetical protein